MAIVSFPRGLPLPQVDGFTQQSGQVFTVSEPADGPSRYRLERLNPPDIFSASLILTRKQKGMFTYFYNYSLKKAMLWFYMPLMYDFTVKYYLCHLRSIPSFNLLSGIGAWSTTFDLEVDVTAEVYDSDPAATNNLTEFDLPIIIDDNPLNFFEFYPDVVGGLQPDQLYDSDILQSEGSP